MAKAGTIDHPKTRKLARRMKAPAYAALGLLEAIWDWAGRYAVTGFISTEDLEDLKTSLRFRGKLDAILIETGWLDEVNGGFYIHDWHVHAQDRVKIALKRAGKNFYKPNTFEPKCRDTAPTNPQHNSDKKPTTKPSLAMPSHTKPRECVDNYNQESARADRDDPHEPPSFLESEKDSPDTVRRRVAAYLLGVPRYIAPCSEDLMPDQGEFDRLIEFANSTGLPPPELVSIIDTFEANHELLARSKSWAGFGKHRTWNAMIRAYFDQARKNQKPTKNEPTQQELVAAEKARRLQIRAASA